MYVFIFLNRYLGVELKSYNAYIKLFQKIPYCFLKWVNTMAIHSSILT